MQVDNMPRGSNAWNIGDLLHPEFFTGNPKFVEKCMETVGRCQYQDFLPASIDTPKHVVCILFQVHNLAGSSTFETLT
jgi:hypothetical protein